MTIAAAVAFAALLTGNAVADDWDLTDHGRSAIASLSFREGLTLAAQCDDGQFNFIIEGLPPTDGATRVVKVQLGNAAEATYGFTNMTPDTAISTVPAPLVRSLRPGGVLTLTILKDDQSASRVYIVELPPSSAALDHTLAACGRPIDDARLIEYPAAVAPLPPDGRKWDILPRGEFPGAAARAGVTGGEATLSCVALPDGRLEDCVVESEWPARMNFGREALKGVGRARLKTPVSVEAGQGTVVTFTQVWTAQ